MHQERKRGVLKKEVIGGKRGRVSNIKNVLRSLKKGGEKSVLVAKRLQQSSAGEGEKKRDSARARNLLQGRRDKGLHSVEYEDCMKKPTKHPHSLKGAIRRRLAETCVLRKKKEEKKKGWATAYTRLRRKIDDWGGEVAWKKGCDG